MQKLFRGGGTIADTLNDVPKAIKTMLKENYKKIAIVELYESFKTSNVTINYPGPSFTASKIYLIFTVEHYNDIHHLAYDKKNVNAKSFRIGSGYIKLTELNENKATMVLSGYNVDNFSITIEEVIFIE